MVERRDVEFEVECGDRLRGWLFVPGHGSGPRPAISMAHGYAAVKEHGLERFAGTFAEAGFVVLVHDHRNFGASYGAVSHDVDPWPPGVWENSVAVRSTRLARAYEPGIWVSRVSPTPLMVVVALADCITLTDMVLRAREQALEPKKPATIEGGHFDPYFGEYPRASASALSWFRQHLSGEIMTVLKSTPVRPLRRILTASTDTGPKSFEEMRIDIGQTLISNPPADDIRFEETALADRPPLQISTAGVCVETHRPSGRPAARRITGRSGTST